MRREFIETKVFRATWKEAGYDEQDLRDLQMILLENPTAGKPIVGGMRKYRHSFDNSGKSGGSRVIYYDYLMNGQIYLLYCFRKKESDNLTDEQKKALMLLVRGIKGGE